MLLMQPYSLVITAQRLARRLLYKDSRLHLAAPEIAEQAPSRGLQSSKSPHFTSSTGAEGNWAEPLQSSLQCPSKQAKQLLNPGAPQQAGFATSCDLRQKPLKYMAHHITKNPQQRCSFHACMGSSSCLPGQV